MKTAIACLSAIVLLQLAYTTKLERDFKAANEAYHIRIKVWSANIEERVARLESKN
jgi:hypothetical protein